MSEKVKVSSQVGKALDSAFKMYAHEKEKENSILVHTIRGTWSEEREILHEIDPIELAKILINGYEVEKTPEEIISTNYQNAITKVAKSSIEDISTNAYWRGYRDATKVTIDILGITIPSINGGESNE